MDGDDWIDSSSIERVIAILKEEKPDIVATDFFKAYGEEYIENPKRLLKRKKKIELFNEYNKYPQNISKILEYDLFNPSLCCNIFKKELFTKHNIFLEENVKFTEDMDCSFKLLLKSKKVFVLDKPMYIYRQTRSDSATKSYSQKRIEDTMNFVIKWTDTFDYSDFDKYVSEYLISFANYQYSIVVAMLFSTTKEVFKANYLKIKLHKDKLKKCKGVKGKFINIAYRLLGFDLTGRLLSLWLRTKDRVKKGK